MKSDLDVEIIFKYIVRGLIELNKKPEEIKEILESNMLCSRKTIQKYDALVKKLLDYSWDPYFGYKHQVSIFDNEKKNHGDKKKIEGRRNQEYEEGRDDNIYLSYIVNNIINSKNGEVPYIEELRLACTLDDDYPKIEISQNDTATLLKNIACIESKLNQIARSVNIIAKAFNISRKNMDSTDGKDYVDK